MTSLFASADQAAACSGVAVLGGLGLDEGQRPAAASCLGPDQRHRALADITSLQRIGEPQPQPQHLPLGAVIGQVLGQFSAAQ